MTKKALLIGVSRYTGSLSNLSTPVRNVEALKQVLENPAVGGYTVMFLHNPVAQQMRIEIEQFFSTSGKGDLALLFFSGHGIVNDRNDLFFTASDTQLNADGALRQATAVATQTVRTWMTDSDCKRQVVILDCCYSGAFSINGAVFSDGKIDIQKQLVPMEAIAQTKKPADSEENPLGKEGRAVLTSSDTTEYSWEQSDSELSIYTRYLVEGLKTGVADSDEDSHISASGLHEYTRNRVREETPAMNPKFFAHKEGHGILLAQSRPEDPEAVYRRAVTHYAKEGEVPSGVRPTLDALREALGEQHNSLLFTPEWAKEIEEKVLQPGRKLQRKKQVYRQEFVKLLKSEQRFPLSEETSKILKELQRALGLRHENIEPIHKDEVLKLCKSKLTEVVEQESGRIPTKV